MNLLALRTNLHHPAGEDVPFSVYTVGTERQSAITRMKGFSANQLFLTFSGSGIFRPLGQDKWDTIEPNTMLYIPAGLPHEYVPQSSEPWLVGYVTFLEKRGGMLDGWGFGSVPYKLRLGDMNRLMELLEGIWSNSGPHFDTWRSTEQLFSFCAELKKQATACEPHHVDGPAKGARYRDSVDSAVRFLHDHLHRDLSMAELASHVGYSPKHLNRLFRRDIGMTPMTYLQRVRLKTAALLLAENPGMTVRQAAAHIGMEPVYFTRLFRRAYGTTPSDFKQKQPGG
ncbi:helix-turn-helix domain-containing protein [Paenibacillus mesophilus]|uniref:AraC family transcriptional regulator n=1 Tax=Paenibacillus mesophilus TaxID=2582849 RepID=UPI00110D848A|nr:AraC family transcriptional regulator [Paenibacillus mesophilus]TMV46985.1 helix-turn-helix domain-containing protein [Paenibacillus mesophilus]